MEKTSFEEIETSSIIEIKKETESTTKINSIFYEKDGILVDTDSEIYEDFCAVQERIKYEKIEGTEDIETVHTESATLSENCEIPNSAQSLEFSRIISESTDNTPVMSLCRLCTTRSDSMVHMFSQNNLQNDIIVKIEFCLPIEVKKTDTLPKEVCHLCLEKLELCYEFHKTVKAAEKQFLTFVDRQYDEEKYKSFSDLDTHSNIVESQAILQELSETDTESLDNITILSNSMLRKESYCTNKPNEESSTESSRNDDQSICNSLLTGPLLILNNIEETLRIEEINLKNSEEEPRNDTSDGNIVVRKDIFNKPTSAEQNDIDSSETGDEDKDEDHVQYGETVTTDVELSNVETDNESNDDNPSILNISNRKTSAPDDMNMHVATSATPSHTKKYFCAYCKTLQSKLARHLEYRHANEQDVKKFINLPVRHHERLQIIAAIRKRGNHLFNTDRRFNDGNLLVCRRPNERMKKGAPDFLACAKCKGQYARSVIRHHWAKCTQRKGRADRIVMVKGRAVMWRLHEKASELVNKYIFAYLREDSVVRSIRYDEILILYANKQAEQYGTDQHSYQMVRARMRLLGRLLIAIKRIDSRITDFASIFNPRWYDNCVAAVKVVANFDVHTRTFGHPAVAMNVGTLLKHVGELLRAECIKSEDKKKQKRVENFLKLMIENFGTAINRAVAETQMQNNRRKKVELPSIKDIEKLREYLNTQRKNCIEILSTNFSSTAWRRLAEVTLVSLQIFNRRRAGEIERIYIEDYESSQGIDASTNKEVFDSLSKEAQALALKYVRFMIRGKRGRGVPVLVPSDLRESMDIIRKFRRQAKVADGNPYFFGLRSDPDRYKYLRACDLLRQFAAACDAKVPDSLRGAKLRKHIATQCINLNLFEMQVSNLANFMGHHEKIHKEIYRQPIVERDITKMAKLLEIAQGAEDCVEDAAQLTGSDTDEDIIDNDIHVENIMLPQAVQASSSKENQIPTMNNASNKRKRETTVSSNKNKIHQISNDSPISKRSWSEGEKSAVLKAFGSYLKDKKLPSKWQLEDMIAKNKCMKGRTAPQVKTWLHNQRRKTCIPNELV